MSKEQLTHSDRYVRKTNRIILIIGIISLFVFLFGIMLLSSEPVEEENHYDTSGVVDESADIGQMSSQELENEIQFGEAEEIGRPITMIPEKIDMGKIILGRTASNVLTIGTNSKMAIRIISVDLEEPAFDGFKFSSDCNGRELRGKETCLVRMNWEPTVVGNVQNNFKIIWHETNVSAQNSKHDEVPVYGSVVRKDDCNICDSSGNTTTGESVKPSENGRIRYAIGPDGKVIGIIGEDGIVRDFDGNEIGKVNNDGMIVDKYGNIIGVSSTDKLLLDGNGNVIGYVDNKGDAYDMSGTVIGHTLSDGTVVDENGVVIGKAISRGYVYDKDGNIIGRVLEDGSVVDLDGNVIGRVNENGDVVDLNGKIIGSIAKSGEIAFDENGNILGVVMPNGEVVNENGDVVGNIGEDGNVYTKQTIGSRGSAVQLAVDKDGNVIGYIGEDGKVYDFNGNLIGNVDKNGNIIDKDGNLIGKVSNQWRDLALDENGKVIGYIDEDGLFHNVEGIISGYVDEKGNIIGNKGKGKIIGEKGDKRRLALDNDGNVIGYIGEDGNVYDFDGNLIGTVDGNGNIIDSNGVVIGKVGNEANLALDKKGNIIGYINEKNIVKDKNNKILGIVDKDGNIRAFGIQKIGSLLDKNLIPITPAGTVLGEINHRGEILNQKQVIGRMRPNGIVTDKSGSKILAQGVNPGYVVNWGCNYESRLDRDGIVRKNGEETDNRVYADGTVWTANGEFAGKIVKTGSVYDNECNYIGEANADGYVRDTNNKEIGCLNPDGTVLDLEYPRIKGHLVEPTKVYSLNWNEQGNLDENGTLRNSNREVIGCVNSYGEVFDKDMAYIGSVSKAKYAFSFDGKPLGYFNKEGDVSISGVNEARVFMKNLLITPSNEIIGYAAPEVNILINAKGEIMGHLFPDGNIYDSVGNLVDKLSGNGTGIYNGEPAKFLEQGHVVDMDGQLMGTVNYDMKVVDIKGTIIGKVDAKGRMYDDNDRQIGGIVKQGGVRGYNGMYLGYVISTGEVVELQNTEDTEGNKISRGDITGKVTPDGHIVKEGKIIGEVLPEGQMVDLFGKYVGFSNAYGLVIGTNNQYISMLLPGGVTNDNISAMPQGIVINYSGKYIGSILPDGTFMDTNRTINGYVMADGKVVSYEGNMLGEVISGDIVIGNDDNVKGRIGFDGKVYGSSGEIGKILTDGLAIDKQNNVLGHTYSIGTSVLSNSGEYIGRLSSNGRVIVDENKEIGYIKSNGSFIDADKNVSGYLLPEVAKNRRN